MKNKTEKKKRQESKMSLVILCSAIIGAMIGFLSGPILENYSIEVNVTFLIIGVVAFFISYLIHILLHEAGHLIFGLLTGYQYVSFRVGTVTWIKEEGKFKQKRMNLPGTAGQCLMSPPDYKNGDFPFVLYNLGGILINLLFSIFAVSLILNGIFLSPLTMLLWSAFALAGLFTAVTNGIPMKVGGMPNDGYNIYLMMKEIENKQAFFMQLKIIGLMTTGTRLKDIPLKQLQLEGEKDYSNSLKVCMYLMEYNWYMDQLEFDEAESCLAAFHPYLKELPAVYKNELDCEHLFFELINESDPFVVKNLYTKELQQYIKITTHLPNKKRLMMAYEAFHQKNHQTAHKYYKELLKTAANYPVKAEADMERMLGEWIIEKMSYPTIGG